MSSTDSCISCGAGLVESGFSIFDCPNCGEEVIGRCVQCKEHSTPYTCPKCGFTGP